MISSLLWGFKHTLLDSSYSRWTTNFVPYSLGLGFKPMFCHVLASVATTLWQRLTWANIQLEIDEHFCNSKELRKSYRGDIVILLWFRPSDALSDHLDLVNMIETIPSRASSSHWLMKHANSVVARRDKCLESHCYIPAVRWACECSKMLTLAMTSELGQIGYMLSFTTYHIFWPSDPQPWRLT